MQCEFPCSSHEGSPVIQICLDPSCDKEKLLCSLCVIGHPQHRTLPFDDFRQHYSDFQKVCCGVYYKIQQYFNDLRQVFQTCIKKAEERVSRQFLENFNPTEFPAIASIEFQQLYGIVQTVISHPIFEQLASGKPISKIKLDVDAQIDLLEQKVLQLKSELIVPINRFAADSGYYISQLKRERIVNTFLFCKNSKSNLLRVEGDGKILARPTDECRGLSVYGIVDKPLTKTKNNIAFKILHQKHRFFYFGVCDPVSFSNHKFMGPVYEKGNRMYAIRQSIQEGQSAVCLHNSIQAYSNKEIVGWDFREGDKIRLQYFEDERRIVFWCNDQMSFSMPLDNQLKEPYPFVGMKFLGDQIMILQEDIRCEVSPIREPPRKVAIKKSFFNFN